jgi:hypothetical protein
MAEVVNVRVACIRPKYSDLEDWTRDPSNVYIGRKAVVFIGGRRYPPADSQWANPFKVGRDGTRREVIDKYRIHLTGLLSTEEGSAALEQLRGRRLGCWCAPEPCHGDLLVEALRNRRAVDADQKA